MAIALAEYENTTKPTLGYMVSGSVMGRRGMRDFMRMACVVAGGMDELRRRRGVKRHWLMVFLANVLLQLSSPKGGPVAWIKAGLATVGSKCRYAMVEVLKSFIRLVMKLAEKLRTLEEALKLTLSDWKGLKAMYQMEIT